MDSNIERENIIRTARKRILKNKGNIKLWARNPIEFTSECRSAIESGR